MDAWSGILYVDLYELLVLSVSVFYSANIRNSGQYYYFGKNTMLTEIIYIFYLIYYTLEYIHVISLEW